MCPPSQGECSSCQASYRFAMTVISRGRAKMPQGGLVSPNGGPPIDPSTSESSTLSSLFRSPLEDERLTILFQDPLWEEAFLTKLASDHDKHQWKGFLFSAFLAIVFAWRGGKHMVTWESKLLLFYTVLCVLGNLSWVAIHFLRPRIAAQWRHPVAVILAVAIHSAIISLPPLAYASWNAPSNAWRAVAVRLRVPCLWCPCRQRALEIARTA